MAGSSAARRGAAAAQSSAATTGPWARRDDTLVASELALDLLVELLGARARRLDLFVVLERLGEEVEVVLPARGRLLEHALAALRVVELVARQGQVVERV